MFIEPHSIIPSLGVFMMLYYANSIVGADDKPLTFIFSHCSLVRLALFEILEKTTNNVRNS